MSTHETILLSFFVNMRKNEDFHDFEDISYREIDILYLYIIEMDDINIKLFTLSYRKKTIHDDIEEILKNTTTQKDKQTLALTLFEQMYAYPYYYETLPAGGWYAIRHMYNNKDNGLTGNAYKKALAEFNNTIDPLYHYYYNDKNGKIQFIKSIEDGKLLFGNNNLKKEKSMNRIIDIILCITNSLSYSRTESLFMGDMFIASCRFYQRMIGLGESLKPYDCKRWKNPINIIEDDDEPDEEEFNNLVTEFGSFMKDVVKLEE